MNKAVFLDRDGTINRDFGYVYQKEKLEFLPGAAEALKQIRQAGFLLIVITNQSGIARGYFSLEQYRDFEAFFLDRLREQDVWVDKVYFCPHGAEEGCLCRKPETGLFYQAAKEFDIDWSRSYAVGDRERDLCICSREPVTGILYGSGESSGPDVICLESWAEIAELICRNP